MRIFLDANILFSAAKSDGAVSRLLNELTHAGHQQVADAYVLSEARRNLESKYSPSLSRLDELPRGVEIGATLAHPIFPAELTELPEKDRPVLAAAIRLRCDALLTGDRSHFGAFFGKIIGGVAVHSPRTMAVELLGHTEVPNPTLDRPT